MREATAVSVAVDECDARKIIRVRCDTPEPPHQWDGVLGIIRKRYGLRATTEHILYLQQGVCRSARVSRFCNKCKKSELRQSSNLIDPGFGVLSVRSVDKTSAVRRHWRRVGGVGGRPRSAELAPPRRDLAGILHTSAAESFASDAQPASGGCASQRRRGESRTQEGISSTHLQRRRIARI